MLFLSPAKLLIILVVALTVLGPDTLPRVAKQIGGFWGEFKSFRQKLESEVRGSFPDLPSTEAITQAVRSPVTFLDTLADTHTPDPATVPEPAGTRAPTGASREPGPTGPAVGVPAGDPAGVAGHHVRLPTGGRLDHPGMN